MIPVRPQKAQMIPQIVYSLYHCSTIITRYSQEPEHDNTMNEEVFNEEPTVYLQRFRINHFSFHIDSTYILWRIYYLLFPLLQMQVHQFLYLRTYFQLFTFNYCHCAQYYCCYCYIYFFVTTIPFNPPPFSHHIGLAKALDFTATPLEYFMLLFDEDCFQLVVDQTNLYASQNPPG